MYRENLGRASCKIQDHVGKSINYYSCRFHRSVSRISGTGRNAYGARIRHWFYPVYTEHKEIQRKTCFFSWAMKPVRPPCTHALLDAPFGQGHTKKDGARSPCSFLSVASSPIHWIKRSAAARPDFDTWMQRALPDRRWVGSGGFCIRGYYRRWRDTGGR